MSITSVISGPVKKSVKSILSTLINKVEGIKDAQKRVSQDQQQVLQLQLQESYRLGAKNGVAPVALHERGFKVFSENTEDGVLLYIFSMIGVKNYTCVEIGCGYGNECNTANLIIHHNWKGLLIDAGEKQIAHTHKFFNSFIKKEPNRPVTLRAHITTSNVNKLIEDNGFDGEIDLLSVDLDGVDYWIWKEIESCNPRVVVVEIQCIWESKASLTVPYDDHFKADFIDGYGIYSGASLAAFNKLAQKKGYRFIGVEQSGYNAFFVRNDIQSEQLPEEEITVIDTLPFVTWARNKFSDKIKKKEWVDV